MISFQNTHKTVLTAANCFEQGEVEKVIVVAADHDRINNDRTEIRIDVSASGIHIHPKRDRVAHDLAIIRLIDALPIGGRDTYKIDYACLPAEGQVIEPGTKCWAAGWGLRNEGRQPQDLREVDLNVYSDEECNSKLDMIFYKENTYDIMMCAGNDKVGIFHKNGLNSLIFMKK